MDTKQLLSWAFEIVIYAKAHQEVITKIKVYKTEEYHFGKKYYRINFNVLDDIALLLEIDGYEKLKTEKTDIKNRAWGALHEIERYKSFYSLHFSEEIVDVHYDWILTVLDSLIFTHKLDLKIKSNHKYEKQN